MFNVRIVTDELPGISELEAVLDGAAWANARWWAAEVAAGREPPCCLECGGIAYRPDQPSTSRITIHTGASLLAQRAASCDEVAAYVLGVRRAKAGIAGLDAYDVGRVRVDYTDNNMMHAVVELPDGTTLDDTEGMKPWTA